MKNNHFEQRLALRVLGVLLIVLLLGMGQGAVASDKYGGGSSQNVSSGNSNYSVRTNTSSRTGATDVYNRSTQTTTSFRDYNGDGDYTDPNEQMSSRPSSGGNGSSSSVPPCTGIDIAVTNIRLEPAGQPAAAATTGQTSRFAVTSASRTTTNSYSAGSVTTSATAITGVSYVPVVTVQNIGCRATNYAQTTTSGSSYNRLITSRTTSNNFKNELPYGANGGFPVQLRIDLGADGSFETSNYTFNQGPLAPGQAITVRFPAIVISRDGNHIVRAIADPTNVQAPNNSCAPGTLGDWGCVRETGSGANNIRTLNVQSATPSVTLGSFIINTNIRLIGSTQPVVGASTANSRDISALTAQQQMGLYWVGQSVNFSTCTGSIRTNTGNSLTGFSGQRDTAGLSLWALLRLPTGADRVDSNIPEPGQDEQYTYTISCRTSAGTVVTDSLNLFRGEVVVVPEGPTPDCSDNIDNDTDGVLDQNDSGCWTNPTDSGSYDPDDTNEFSGPANTPTITATPELVRRGEPVRIEWNTRGNTGCVVAGSGIATPINASGPGNTTVTVSAQSTYTISCDQGATADVVVTILPILYES